MKSAGERRHDEIQGEAAGSMPTSWVQLSSVPALAFGLSVIAMIGLVDWWTGIYVAFSPFYLAPISIAAWWHSRRVAFTLVVASTASWYAAEYGWEHSFPGGVSFWNGAARLLIFGLVAALIIRVRAQASYLAAMNLRLDAQLQREREISRTDPLTALANRRAFLEALHVAVARARRSGGPVSLAILDLDNFKRVNDSYGHEAGDALLVAVSEGLLAGVRQGDVVARLGGDEFGVIFDDASNELSERITGRFLAVVEKAAAKWPDACVGVSIGLVNFVSAPADAETIVRAADQVMYRSKREGKGRVTTDNGVSPPLVG